jgi:hypothetical protein
MSALHMIEIKTPRYCLETAEKPAACIRARRQQACKHAILKPFDRPHHKTLGDPYIDRHPRTVQSRGLHPENTPSLSGQKRRWGWWMLRPTRLGCFTSSRVVDPQPSTTKSDRHFVTPTTSAANTSIAGIFLSPHPCHACCSGCRSRSSYCHMVRTLRVLPNSYGTMSDC